MHRVLEDTYHKEIFAPIKHNQSIHFCLIASVSTGAFSTVTLFGLNVIWTTTKEIWNLVGWSDLFICFFYNENTKLIGIHCIWHTMDFFFFKLSYLVYYLTIEVFYLFFSKRFLILCFYDKSCLDNLQLENKVRYKWVVGPQVKEVKDICFLGLTNLPDLNALHDYASAQSIRH